MSYDDDPTTKQVKFTPGKGSLEEKIGSKIHNTKNDAAELTPFEKYLEKRKQKRKERKAAARNKKLEVDEQQDSAYQDDGMYGYDLEFGMAKFSDEESGDKANDQTSHEIEADNDDFFLKETGDKKKADEHSKKQSNESEEKSGQASTKEELELLIAGDAGECAIIYCIMRLYYILCINLTPFVSCFMHFVFTQTKNISKTTTCVGLLSLKDMLAKS